MQNIDRYIFLFSTKIRSCTNYNVFINIIPTKKKKYDLNNIVKYIFCSNISV